MKNKEEFGSISLTLIPVIEKGQLPDENKPISAHTAKKQGNYAEYALLAAIHPRPQKPLNLNELKTSKLEAEFTMTPKETESAKKHFEEVNREYKDKYKKEGKKVVIELLEKHPQFIYVPWVKKALKEKPVKSGRKFGDTRISRTSVQAVINALIEKGHTKDEAFRCLASGGIGKRYSETLYSEAKKLNKPMAMPFGGINFHCPSPEQYVSQFKGSISERMEIYNPEYIMEWVSQRYGNEVARRVMLVYIEDAETLLAKNDDNETILHAKKILQENNFLEKAKFLIKQL